MGFQRTVARARKPLCRQALLQGNLIHVGFPQIGAPVFLGCSAITARIRALWVGLFSLILTILDRDGKRGYYNPN